MIRILGIGHSHIGAFIFTSREFPRSDVSFDFINLLDSRYLGKDNAIFFDEIREDALAKAAEADVVVLSLSGNEHHVLGMVAPERPFDFCLPQGDKNDVFHGHELIPLGLVRGTIERILSKRYYEFFSGLFDRPVYAVSPPPPILDSSHIATYPGAYKDAIAQRGISPPWLRLKLWRLYCLIAQDWSREAGFEFLDVPQSNIGPEGFLHYAALLNDPTHANAWYGQNMVNHLLTKIEMAHG